MREKVRETGTTGTKGERVRERCILSEGAREER